MDLILIELIDSLSHSIDNNEYTIGILVDLSKTFDTVETKIVISKLNHYGIRGTPLMWYNDYLSDRKQTVRFSETRGLLKKLAYNDSLDNFYFFLYTILQIALIFSILLCLLMVLAYIIPTEIWPHFWIRKINCELDKLSDWFKANKRSLKLKKTNYTIFAQEINPFQVETI